jgi:hypothetical protein
VKVSNKGGGGMSKTTVWFKVIVEEREPELAGFAAGEEEDLFTTTGLSSAITRFTSTGDCTLICSKNLSKFKSGVAYLWQEPALYQ